MMYLVEKDGKQIRTNSLEGYEAWAVIQEEPDFDIAQATLQAKKGEIVEDPIEQRFKALEARLVALESSNGADNTPNT